MQRLLHLRCTMFTNAKLLVTLDDIFAFVELLISKLKNADIEYVFSEAILNIKDVPLNYWNDFKICKDEDLAKNCDVVVSIGGDGTLLHTAYLSRKYGTPLLGVNFGKLGYLAEFETGKIDELIEYLKSKDLIIERRNA